MIKSIEKVGSVIVITLSEKEKPITYDCKNEVLTSFSGRQVKNVPKILLQNWITANVGQRLLIDALQEKTKGKSDMLERMEQYIPVLDLIQCNWTSLPCPCPKGFIEYIKQKGKIERDSYWNFTQEDKLKRVSQEEKEFLEKIKEAFHETNDNYKRALNMGKEERLTLMKIFKTTVKKIVWDLRSDFYQFMQNIKKFDFIETKWTDIVDTNRDFKYNNKLIGTFFEEEKNKLILENEKKIKAIEKLESENLIVIVPDNMEDFTNEGHMQNNCVGYFYHDSISRGENYIYFIRKKDNPEKSYITNRFNNNYGRTMETLKSNNRNNDDKEALTLIYKIDELINKLI